MSFLLIEKRCPPVDRHGEDDKRGRKPKGGFGDEGGFGPRAVGPVLTGDLGLEVDLPEAEADEDKRNACEIRLVGLKRGKVADPGPGDAEHYEQQRHHAAGRGQNTAWSSYRCPSDP